MANVQKDISDMISNTIILTYIYIYRDKVNGYTRAKIWSMHFNVKKCTFYYITIATIQFNANRAITYKYKFIYIQRWIDRERERERERERRQKERHGYV